MEWVRGDCIGCGSSSRVYLASPQNSSPPFPSIMAVKSCDQSHTCLLDNEREVLKEVGSHPQIIHYFGDSCSIEENNGCLHNLMLEYAKGGSLSQKINSCGSLQEGEVRDHARSILKGLCHIHAKGIVHCDIKLENILLFEDGKVKIADFGLAIKAGQKQGKMEIRGTPLYMAPESVNNNEYESSVDIWALGCAIVEMLTGKPAWNHRSGANMFLLLMRIGESDELPAVPEELSQQGKDFLSKCFSKDPSQRWTAAMLLEHSFVADQAKDTLPSREELSTSPRCHFDFPCQWASSPRSEVWSDDEKDELMFPSISNSSRWTTPHDRIGQMASDHCCNWSDAECWVTVR